MFSRNLGKFSKPFLATVGFCFVLFGLPLRVAHASVPIMAGKLVQSLVFGTVAAAHERIDIVQTLMNFVSGFLTEVPITFTFQRSYDEVFNCGVQDIADVAGGPDGARAVLTRLNPGIAEMEEDVVAGSLSAVSTYEPDVCDFSSNQVGTRNGGSLAGIGVALQNAVTSPQPIPVNMAYYFKDYASRIPILKDTAYAATSSENILGGPLILNVWKQARNVAYGIISVAMLIIGIMIMTRKKINPQVAVTVQSAIPRIAIALVLITFSYPIGALFAGLVPAFIRIAHTVFIGMAAADVNPLGDFASSLPSLAVFLITVLGASVSGGIIAVVALVLSLIMWLVALIRIIFIYVKMLLSIIIAPIQFAIGAVPGSEATTIDWFKSMAAKLISVPAMFFMIMMAWYVLFQYFILVVRGGMETTTWKVALVEVGLGGGAIVLYHFFTLFLVVVCLGASIKAPSIVEKWLIGDKKKK